MSNVSRTRGRCVGGNQKVKDLELLMDGIEVVKKTRFAGENWGGTLIGDKPCDR